MKKLLVILMVLALAGAVQANEVLNPSFESYTVDGNGVPTFDSWTVWQWGASTVAVNPDAYDGLVSFEVVSNVGSGPGEMYWAGGAGAYQHVPMVEGYTVSISAYAKDLTQDGSQPGAASGIDLVFFSYGPNDPMPDTPPLGGVDLHLDGSVTVRSYYVGTYSGSMGPPDANGWRYGYLEAVTPVGTKWMKFEVNNNNDDGMILFDKVVGIPEPVTIALLGLGGLFLRRRK